MAIPNRFFNLDEAPDRYGVDVQTLPNKKEPYKLCDCGNMIYIGDDIWTINGGDYCKECLEEGINNCKREAW